MKKSRLMLAVTAAAVCAALGFPAVAHDHVRNDPVATLEQMQNRLLEVGQALANITNRADGEARDLTPDERTEFDNLFAEFGTLEGDIQRYEQQAAVNATMTAGRGRQAEPNANRGEQTPAAQSAAGAQPNATRAQAAAGRNSVPAQPRDNRELGHWGWRSSAEFMRNVVMASRQGNTPDPRLIQNAPTTWGSEGVGADGGFAVPPDFRTEILRKITGEESLLPRTDQLSTSSNSITFPTDSTAPWDESGGIQAYWESEGGQKQQSKPQLGETTIKANKIISLVPMTDELLQDAPAMAAYVNSKAPEKIDFKVTQALIRGTGVGQPLGVLNSAGTLVVPKVSGQAADSVVMQNIMDLYYSVPRGRRGNAVWLMNEDVERQLPYMKFIDQGSGNAVPVYLPPGGLSSSPYGTLLGRPIIPSEGVSGLGDEGDIIFGDWSQYHTLVKGGGVRQDVSIHLFFDYDMTAFRFVLRVGGQPKWNSPIARPNGGTQRAFFATLAARA